MGKAIREVYGEALVKYGKDDERIVVLDADTAARRSRVFSEKRAPSGF